MKKAVMYGGGNIGRGFIGMLFSQSGYEVAFIDVAKPVIEHLNTNRCYPVRILKGARPTCLTFPWMERMVSRSSSANTV